MANNVAVAVSEDVAAPAARAAARAPYPGLRAFRRDESDLFFGREDFVNTMVDRLAGTRFLAVLGSSGTGKSSVVKTGLLDSLELGLMAKAGSNWRVADFRPGSEPLQNLADGLLTEDGQTTERERELLRGFLARGPRAVIEWCRDGNLPAGTNLLVLADQFEELFRYQDYARREETQALVELLLESARSTEFPIYVVVTMRSEYLGACASLEGLAEAISRGMVLIPRLTRNQCREAIEGPAAACGIRISPSLVNRLLNDLASFAAWDESGGADELDKQARKADQLPLLQYTLNRMWLKARERTGDRNRDGGPLELRVSDYEDIGGLSGALNAHAEQLYKGLEARGLDGVTEQVFRGLVAGATVAEAVRRPRPLGELVALAEGKEAGVREVVDTFRAAGVNYLTPELNPADPKRLEPKTFIDISHESLIRQWSRLSQWLELEARAAHNWRRLKERIAYDEPLQGRELADLIAWRDATKPNAEWSNRYGDEFEKVMGYLARSQRTEQERVEASRRAELDARRRDEQRKRRLLIVGAAAALAIVLVSSGLAIYFTSLNAKLTKEQANLEAANSALVKALGDAKTAEAQAKAALKQMQAAQQEAEQAKQQAKLAQEAAAKAREAQEKRSAAAKTLGPVPEKGTNYADETTDFKVSQPAAPQTNVNSATPTLLTGGQVLTTYDVYEAIANATLGKTLFIVDAWNGWHNASIPTSTRMPTAGLGMLDSKATDALWQALHKMTGGNFGAPIIFFSHDVRDWEGFNAALRAIQMGYDKVYWYRGGLASWQAAHLNVK